MRFVIVSGMSGAGKSTALNVLEDEDFYCVDNLPVALIRSFVQIASDGTASEFTKFAIGLDIRSAMKTEDLESAIRDLEKSGFQYELVFLDAADDVLLRRFKETRRIHPLSGKTGSIEDGVREERRRLNVLKSRADYVIDTSKLLTRELKTEIVRIFTEDRHFDSLFITVQSFGFKYGIPADSDLVADVRFLPNPYYVGELRPLTGKDQPIIDFVMEYEESRVFIKKYTDLLKFLIPHYIGEGKNQLVVSIGCTGGRHRSVCLAEAIAESLMEDGESGVRVWHRDIDKDPAHKK